MSLIKCAECNKEISDTAHRCPNCGYKEVKVDSGYSTSILVVTTLFVAFILVKITS